MIRQLLVCVFVLTLVATAQADYWFASESYGDDSMMDGEQNIQMPGGALADIDDRPATYSSGFWTITLLDEFDTSYLEEQCALGRKILHVKDHASTNDCWMEIASTDVESYTITCTRFGTDGEDLTSVTSVDLIGTGPKRTISSVMSTAASVTADHTIYLNGVFNETLSSSSISSGHTWEFTVLNSNSPATIWQQSSGNESIYITGDKGVVLRNLNIFTAAVGNRRGVVLNNSTLPVVIENCYFNGRFAFGGSCVVVLGTANTATARLTVRNCEFYQPYPSVGVIYLCNYDQVIVDNINVTPGAVFVGPVIHVKENVDYCGGSLVIRNCSDSLPDAMYIQCEGQRVARGKPGWIEITDNDIQSASFLVENGCSAVPKDQRWSLWIHHNTLTRTKNITTGFIAMQGNAWNYLDDANYMFRDGGVVISSNTISAGDSVSESPAISLGGRVVNATISDNLIVQSSTTSGTLTGIQIEGRGAVITRNKIYGSNPLVISGVTGFTVDHNTLWATMGSAITIRDAHGTVSIGNHWTGTVRGSTDDSITLDSTPSPQDGGDSTAASSTDNVYNGHWISIVAGTGAGQTRRIKLATGSYTGSTKVALIGADDGVSTYSWSVNPSSADSVYRIVAIVDSGVVQNNIFVGKGANVSGLCIPTYNSPRSILLNNNIYWGDSGGIPANIDGVSLTSLASIREKWQSSSAWTTDPWALIPSRCLSSLNDSNSNVVNPGLNLVGDLLDSWEPKSTNSRMSTSGDYVGAQQRQAVRTGRIIWGD